MAAISLSHTSIGDSKPAKQASAAQSLDAATDDHYMARKAEDNDSFKAGVSGRISGFQAAHTAGINALDSDFQTSVMSSLESSFDAAVVTYGGRKSTLDSDLGTEITAELAEYNSYNGEIPANSSAMSADYDAIVAGTGNLQVVSIKFLNVADGAASATVTMSLDASGDIEVAKS